MKRIPILPTLVTLGNVCCGFLAIGYILKAQADPDAFGLWIGWAGRMILFAMVFDALDGKVARLSHNTSDFGAQLDSLCDVVSFGVAPALIVKALAARQEFLPRFAWVTGMLFLMCATLRLARFNVETDDSEESHMYFNGLPAPGAAGFVAAMTVMFYELREELDAELAGLAKVLEPIMDTLLWFMPFLAVGLALLMISRVRYVHVLNKLLRGQEPLDYLVKLVLVGLFVVLTRPFSLPVLFGLYLLSAPVAWAKEQLFSRIPAGYRHRTSQRD